MIWLSFSAFIQALTKVTRERDLSKVEQKCKYSALFQGFSHRVFQSEGEREEKSFVSRLRQEIIILITTTSTGLLSAGDFKMGINVSNIQGFQGESRMSPSSP